MLSRALIAAKNRLDNPDAWLVLLRVPLPDNNVIRLVDNNENITFQNELYIASSFTLEPPRRDTSGAIQSVQLQVSNVDMALLPYLETYTDNIGGIGFRATIMVVESALLSEDYTDTTMEFDVLSSVVDEQWVTFMLGGPNPLIWRFPLWRYLAGHCKWVGGYTETPRWPECGYSGPLVKCAGTLQDCRLHNNSKRFGGYPGLNNEGIFTT